MTSSLSVACVGDVRVQRDDPSTMFSAVKGLIRECDVAVANLDGALSDGDTLVSTSRPPWTVHRAEPRQVSGLVDAGFGVVGLANNQTMFYGVEGILQTLEVLDKAGIRHAGAGRNLEEAHAPALIERNGIRVGVLSYTSVYHRNVGIWEATAERPGLATVEVTTSYEPPDSYAELPGEPPLIRTHVRLGAADRVRADIHRLRPSVDWIIVSWHWGNAGFGWHPDTGFYRHRAATVMDHQIELGQMAVDAGADLVFGHHPHALQHVEVYKRGLICYSLGNFAVEHRNPMAGRESVVLQVRGDKTGIREANLRPMWRDDDSRPVPVDHDDDRYAAAAALLKGPNADRFEPDGGTDGLRIVLGRGPHVSRKGGSSLRSER